MSILVPDTIVFNYAEAGVIKAAYNRTIDEFYSHTVSDHFRNQGDTFEEARRLTRNWLTLILKSYNTRYEEEGGFELLEEIRRHAGPLEPLQLIKYLQCIDYQIETCTITKNGTPEEDPSLVSEQDKKDLKLLKNFILDLKDAYINRLPIYESAKWSD